IRRIEDAKSRANHGPGSQLVGKPNSWGKIIPVLGDKLSRRITVNGNLGKEIGREGILSSIGDVQSSRGEVVTCLGISPLLRHGNELVAYPQIQRQLAS